MGPVLIILMRRHGTGLLALAGLLMTAGTACSTGGSAHSRPSPQRYVITSTAIWADVVRSVSCGRIPVEPIVPSGADPHEFEVSLRRADRIVQSSLVLANGVGLDDNLSALFVRAREAGTRVVDLGAQLGSRGMLLEGDPHIWMDPENIRELIPTIEDELARLDLVDRGLLTECARRFGDHLVGLIDEIQNRLVDVPTGRRLIVSEHRNLGYFARRFDFDVLGALTDAPNSLAETDASHLERLRKKMNDRRFGVVFVEEGESSEAARTFVRDLSPQGVVVALHIEFLPRSSGAQPHGSSARSEASGLYIPMMLTNADRIRSALSN